MFTLVIKLCLSMLITRW
ncbi:hypothetical protein BsWGS_22995 [Bradybaena similaris]